MAKGDKKKRTINKEFCRHPPWLKDPADLRQNLRNGFSRVDDAETALIVRIEDACYFFWCCGEIIGDRWKDIAAEQLSLFFARNEGRFNETELKFLRPRLKTTVETYTNYYSKQFDLSLEQSEENRKNGLRGAQTKYGFDGKDIGGPYKNDSPAIGGLDGGHSGAIGGPDFCDGQAIQEEEEEKEEDCKDEEQHNLIKDYVAQDNKKKEKDYIRTKNFEYNRPSSALAFDGARPQGPKINKTMIINFFYTWGKAFGDPKYSPDIPDEDKLFIQTKIKDVFDDNVNELEGRLKNLNLDNIEIDSWKDWLSLEAEIPF